VRTPSVVTMVADKEHRDDLDFLTDWVAKPPKVRERLLDHHMNFPVRDVPMGFDELVRRWFALHENLRLALAPFFGLLYAPPTYVDLRLVSISQALEAYDRASGRSRQAMPTEEFASFKQLLMDACPGKHKDFLKQKLGYLNELSQVDRMNYLVERAGVPLRRLLARRPTFAVDFIASRNAKTHPDKEKTAMDGLHMYDLTATATYLFTACVMLDLGFDENLCAQLFQRQPSYVHLPTTLQRSELDSASRR
jgi:ApeA N-terminal domain 1